MFKNSGFRVRAKIAKERAKLFYRNVTSLFFVLTIVSVGLFSYGVDNDVFNGEKSVSVQRVVREAYAQEPSMEIHSEFLEDVDDRITRLADTIHFKESSNGENNYSKCESIGEYNEYGFSIPGDGTYKCFSHGGDRKAVEAWLEKYIAQGMNDNEMLCLYNTGTASQTCEYVQ